VVKLLALFVALMGLAGGAGCVGPIVTPEPTVQPTDYGAIGGGEDNQVGEYATVCGGSRNSATGYHAAVGGGSENTAGVDHSVIGGGFRNTTGGIRTTIGGGYGNVASHLDATVGGGGGNTASGQHTTVSGGSQNTASGYDATVGGGSYNTTSGIHATVGGGYGNTASGFDATVAGGAGNTAGAARATVGGGLANRAASIYGTIGGGYGNVSSGSFSTVPGGSGNQAGGDYSLASGYRAVIDPVHAGAFLYADSNDLDFRSVIADEFAVRATGGVRLVTAIDDSGNPVAGVEVPPGSGSWSSLSDREVKENIVLADGERVLAQLAELPISTWNYAAQDPSTRHIGPMAQDFHAAFGVGEDARHISTIDADGVALASIQGLQQLVQEKDAQIVALEARVTALEQTNRISHYWLLAGALCLVIVSLSRVGVRARVT
jgi:hypothetical protein